MTSEGDLNKSNGDIWYAGDVQAVLSSIGKTAAQNSYEQVKSDSSSWTNTDYLGADIFTSKGGAKSTIDATNTDSIYHSGEGLYLLLITDEASGDTTHDPDSFTNPSNAFDGDDSTYAEKSSENVSLGKTFSAKTIVEVKVKAQCSFDTGTNGDYTLHIILQSYDGSTWTDEKDWTKSDYSYHGTFDLESSYSLNKSVQGLRLKYTASYAGSGGYRDFKIYSLEYAQSYDSSSSVETNTIIDEKVPDSIVVYGKTNIPSDTSIKVDISDDGGTTWSLTDKELDTPIDTSSFSTGNLALKFKLATTDTSKTPKLYGYGVAITDT